MAPLMTGLVSGGEWAGVVVVSLSGNANLRNEIDIFTFRSDVLNGSKKTV